jgi:hypothetical protein
MRGGYQRLQVAVAAALGLWCGESSVPDAFEVPLRFFLQDLEAMYLSDSKWLLPSKLGLMKPQTALNEW